MNRKERIESILAEKLKPSHMELRDESHKHAGHAGARQGGETHYHLIIECPQFSGVNKVKRHQAIYAVLDAEFKSGLHALAIEAFATGER